MDFLDTEKEYSGITILDEQDGTEYRICCIGSGGIFVADLNGKILPEKQHLAGIYLQKSFDGF